ncbi:hypothetical protein [Prescottella subtropica]|uniref:hypothetical protein n=1 Tax=Prescottella subtropica TaxID=2545757 RepID=UPI001F4F5942|nr:hypothetical protein [Prescottella subtropica]
MSDNENVKGCSCGNADYGAPGHDGGPDYLATATAATGDNDGLVTTSVAGVDAHIYAHRSTTVPGALLIGVDAPEGQQILFVVNDGDVLDTTVGEPLPGEVADTGSQLWQARGSQFEDSIAKGHLYATAEARHGETRDRTELVSDAIANLLLFLADSEGAEAATKAAADGAENFREDWLEAGRALSVTSGG